MTHDNDDARIVFVDGFAKLGLADPNGWTDDELLANNPDRASYEADRGRIADYRCELTSQLSAMGGLDKFIGTRFDHYICTDWTEPGWVWVAVETVAITYALIRDAMNAVNNVDDSYGIC